MGQKLNLNDLGTMYRVAPIGNLSQEADSASQNEEVQKSTNLHIGVTQGVKYKRNKCI